MECYERSEYYERMAQEVLRAVPGLRWIEGTGVRIAYEVCDKEQRSKGRRIAGECVPVPARWKLYCPYDFRIIIYEPNASYMSEDQKKILLWHEHLHISCEQDKDGNFKYTTTPHDIEEFRDIVWFAGMDWDRPGAVVPDITRGGG